MSSIDSHIPTLWAKDTELVSVLHQWQQLTRGTTDDTWTHDGDRASIGRWVSYCRAKHYPVTIDPYRTADQYTVAAINWAVEHPELFTPWFALWKLTGE